MNQPAKGRFFTFLELRKAICTSWSGITMLCATATGMNTFLDCCCIKWMIEVISFTMNSLKLAFGTETMMMSVRSERVEDKTVSKNDNCFERLTVLKKFCDEHFHLCDVG